MTQTSLHDPHLVEVAAQHSVSGAPAPARITVAGSIGAPRATCGVDRSSAAAGR